MGLICVGIGREICKSLSSAGAVVYALSKTQQNLDSLVSEVLSVALSVCMSVRLSVCLPLCLRCCMHSSCCNKLYTHHVDY